MKSATNTMIQFVLVVFLALLTALLGAYIGKLIEHVGKEEEAIEKQCDQERI